MTDASSKEITAVPRSRLIRAIHYEPSGKRLSVLTTNGNLKIHENVEPQAAMAIVEHEHPGHAYLNMRYELGPKMARYTPAGFLAALRAKRAMQKAMY